MGMIKFLSETVGAITSSVKTVMGYYNTQFKTTVEVINETNDRIIY